MVETTKDYLDVLKAEFEKKEAMAHPLAYCDPIKVMMDFIHFLIRDMKKIDVSLNFYFGISALDGDNTDNGYFIIDLKKMAKIYSDDTREILKRQVVREKVGNYEIKHVVDPFKEQEKYGFIKPEYLSDVKRRRPS